MKKILVLNSGSTTVKYQLFIRTSTAPVGFASPQILPDIIS